MGAGEFLRRNAVRQANQFEVVGDLAVTTRKDEGNLVGQHQLSARHFKMPYVHGNVLRLGRAAEHVNHLEVLA